eukprot:5287368-Prorocentrum_lima.AAC.1
MSPLALTPVVQLFNRWYNDSFVPPHITKARVVLLYKKGDSNKFENYRPISLLSTVYKLYAVLPGIFFSEVLYADDTAIFGTTLEHIEAFLHAVEDISALYGLNLDQTKGELLAFNT